MITLDNIKDLATMGEVLKLSPVVYDRNIFKIVERVVVELSDKTIVVLEPGWEYDGATVPWIVQWAFPKFGIYSYNSFIHDICYFNHYKSRKFADTEHYIWGKALGINKWDNLVRYYTLRAFGWIYWNKGKTKPSFRSKRNSLLTKIFTNF